MDQTRALDVRIPLVFPAHAAGVLARLRTSPEGREGLSAFLERRKPDWQK